MSDRHLVALTFLPFLECLPRGDPMCFLGISGIVVNARLIFFYCLIFLHKATWLPWVLPYCNSLDSTCLGPALWTCAFSSFVLLCPSLDHQGFPGGSDGKASASHVGDLGSIPGSGRSPGEGYGNPLQSLAWKIPWMEEHCRLQSIGLQRVGHDWATSLFTFIYYTVL